MLLSARQPPRAISSRTMEPIYSHRGANFPPVAAVPAVVMATVTVSCVCVCVEPITNKKNPTKKHRSAISCLIKDTTQQTRGRQKAAYKRRCLPSASPTTTNKMDVSASTESSATGETSAVRVGRLNKLSLASHSVSATQSKICWNSPDGEFILI